MVTQNRKQYLRKQKSKWYFIRRIPEKYQYAFNGAKEYKKKTGCSELEDALIQRDIINIGLNIIFKELGGMFESWNKKKIDTVKALNWSEKNSNGIIIGFKDIQQLKEILI